MAASAAAPQAIRIFVSYAQEDCASRDELSMTLRDLVRDEVIAVWTDHALNPGDDWDDEIRVKLEAAQIIILLVSRAFIASDYIDRVELKRAKERHRAGQARVVPILVSACDWEPKLGGIQAIPAGIPVMNYPDAKNPDKELAWLAVRNGLKSVIAGMTQMAVSPDSGERAAVSLVGEGAPKSCDRSDQISQFCSFYSAMRERRRGFPQLYVLVEEELDRPDFLIERIRNTQVQKLAASVHGDRRASCPQIPCDPCNENTLRGLQGSIELNLRSVFADKSYELASHVIVQQNVNGTATSPHAAKLVPWLASLSASILPATEGPQWLIFLVIEFATGEPDSADLRRKTFESLSTLFPANAEGLRMLNHTPKAKGLPALLLHPPETLTPSHIYYVLRLFPFSSREADRLSKTIHTDLVRQYGAARIEDIYFVIEKIRKRYAKTGELSYESPQGS